MSTKKESPRSIKRSGLPLVVFVFATLAAASVVYFFMLPALTSVSFSRESAAANGIAPKPAPVLDTLAYDTKLLELAHVATSSPFYAAFLSGTTTVGTSTKRYLWPQKEPYPKVGALLPFNRIVSYYGNFYSKGMGVLGQYPPEEMMRRLASTTAQWQAADPSTPVIPALHYIAVVAQGSAGRDGKYRARMPDDQIDKALELAAPVNGLVFLDIQVGLSDLPSEIPLLEKYLKLPNVELGIDPEFAMHNGTPPGRQIGSFDAADINYAARYLAQLVRENNLPPKILVVHRFTEDMVTHAARIQPLPEVQIVMDMDGWGFPAKKINTYQVVVAAEPVQFTGFKLFFKNDLLPPSPGMLTPAQVLNLTPAPSYIQYQ